MSVRAEYKDGSTIEIIYHEMEDGKNNCLAYKDLIYIYVENPFDFFFFAGHNIHVPVEFTRRSYIKALYARVYKYSIPSYATEIL